MQRQVPYTLTNFKRIVTENFYYVDKTMYLTHLEQYSHPVFLRPRRFGKSLFTETLRYYYDLKYASDFDTLFGNLWVGKNPTPNHNKYFFLALDFSGMGAYAKNSEGELREIFGQKIKTSLGSFLEYYAAELGISKTYVHDFVTDTRKDASLGMQSVTGLVNSVGGKMFIAIDEYDSLTNAMAVYYQHAPVTDNLYLDVLKSSGFFRAFFETLKNNAKSGIERVYITGILPITIADMNSGYNIAEWVTFKPALANMLGITEPEFDKLIDEVYADHSPSVDKQHVKDTLKRYYNGYRFSPQAASVYNPSMTMYALKSLVVEGCLPNDLLDSNIRIDYNQISYIFGNNNAQRDQIIEQISRDKQLIHNLQTNRTFDMLSYRNGEYIAEGLYYSGILTYSDSPFVLRIPNIVTYDMALSYFNRTQNFTPNTNDTFLYVYDYMSTGDPTTMMAKYFENVIQAFPGQFFVHANESFYHGLLFHILFNALPQNMYEILPEYNLPQGRADIMCRTLPAANVMAHFADLFEFKQVPKSASDADFDVKFAEAVNQAKRYTPVGWRGIAVCFRGNKDYKIEIVTM